MRKRIQIFAVICSIALLIPGCAMNSGKKVYDNEELIAADYNSYNLVQSKGFVDGNCLTGSALTMEGMGKIWEFDAPRDMDVKIESRIKVVSGKAKLVLIYPDDTLSVLKEYEADSEKAQEFSDTFQVKKGKNRIKLVAGKDTQIEYEISIDQGKMSSFGG